MAIGASTDRGIGLERFDAECARALDTHTASDKNGVVRTYSTRRFLVLCMLGMIFPLSVFYATHLFEWKNSKAFEFPGSAFGSSKITVVTMGYNENRKANYARALRDYRSMCGLVAKVIVVWNNVDVEPPRVPSPRPNTRCNIPVTIVRSTRNSLNNRFTSVIPLVNTSAVFSVDDDVLPSYNLLSCGFSYWLRDRDRIVGMYPRRVLDNGTYSSVALNKARKNKSGAMGVMRSPYNLILTGAAIFDSRFLPLYAEDEKVTRKVDKEMNGEDILFNAMVQNRTKKAGLYVHPTKKAALFGLSSSGGLSTNKTWSDWLARRTALSKWAMEHFGTTVFHSSTRKASCDAV